MALSFCMLIIMLTMQIRPLVCLLPMCCQPMADWCSSSAIVFAASVAGPHELQLSQMFFPAKAVKSMLTTAGAYSWCQ